MIIFFRGLIKEKFLANSPLVISSRLGICVRWEKRLFFLILLLFCQVADCNFILTSKNILLV